jgi:hypothetical protein
MNDSVITNLNDVRTLTDILGTYNRNNYCGYGQYGYSNNCNKSTEYCKIIGNDFIDINTRINNGDGCMCKK